MRYKLIVLPEETASENWGLTDFLASSIKLYTNKSTADRCAQTFYHELVHAIVYEYHIKSMVKKGGVRHNEAAVDLMGLGLKEALASMGIDIMAQIKERLGQ